MVLERIFPEEWLEKKSHYAFLLGIGYSFIGIVLARILFPKDPALVAVAFTSLLILPQLYKLFSIEEKQERADKGKVTWKDLWNDDSDIIKFYTFLFLGVLITYAFAAIILPSFTANNLFQQQLAIRGGTSGAAVSAGQAINFTEGIFWSLLKNNFKVLAICFVVALLTGNGSIFLVIWNASVWGTIFGITAKNAALVAGAHPTYYFLLIMVIVFPHMIIEALSYICASISGSILSKGFLHEKMESRYFSKIVTFNMYLLLVGLGLLLFGALIETFVLDNVQTYQHIIELSFLAAR